MKALLLLPAMVVLFYGCEIYQRAVISLNGRIVSSDTTCAQPENNRCSTAYVVEDASHSRRQYDAGPNDHSLPRRLPIGTVVVKEQWKLGYSLDGKYIDDYPIGFEMGVVVVMFFFGWWLHLRAGARRGKPPGRIES